MTIEIVVLAGRDADAARCASCGLLAHTQIGEVHVRLTAKAETEDAARALNAALEATVRDRLKDFIFGADEETYEGVLSSPPLRSGLQVAAAETAFGSSVIQTMKGMEGSPAFFRLGLTLCEPGITAQVLPGTSLGETGMVGAAARALAGGGYAASQGPTWESA